LGTAPPFIGRATPKLGRAPGAIPPTPFLRPNALIFVLNPRSYCRQRGDQTSAGASVMVNNLEMLKIS
jgi:hypothetical protein